MSDALKEGARDTLKNAKEKAPHDKGGLRGNSITKKESDLNWQVWFDIEYAAFQEFGGDGKRTVRRYKTAGTGKHFLKNAGDEQSRRMVSIFKKHASRARV